ncbi:ribosome biogenesis factor YjgA [Pseudomonadota bacterium]
MMPEEEFDDELLPSKSQIKRECDAIQKLGEELIALKQDELDSMDLPDELDDAIGTARKIKSRAGLKRQRQYIGKIIRQLDSDAIKNQLEQIQHKHDINTVQFRKLERWRDRLLDDDKTALNEIIDSHPEVDRQHINQLIRQAKRELQQEKPPSSARKLFKYLRELQE